MSAPSVFGGVHASHRGKALQVDTFMGEDKAVCLDDWLPSLHRASLWNSWSRADELI